MRVADSSAANRDVKRVLDYYKRKTGVKVAKNFITQLEAKVEKILKSPESYRIGVRDLSLQLLTASRSNRLSNCWRGGD